MPDAADPTRELASLDAALAEETSRRRLIDHAERQAAETVQALERDLVDAMRRNDAAKMKTVERKLADAREAAGRDRRLEIRAADARVRDRQGDITTHIRDHADELLADAQADGQRIATDVDELLAQLAAKIAAFPAIEARITRVAHIVARGHENHMQPAGIDDLRELLRQRRGTTTSGPSFTVPPPAGIIADSLTTAGHTERQEVAS